MFVLQVHWPMIDLSHLGHNISNTPLQTKGESLNMKGLECII